MSDEVIFSYPNWNMLFDVNANESGTSSMKMMEKCGLMHFFWKHVKLKKYPEKRRKIRPCNIKIYEWIFKDMIGTSSIEENIFKIKQCWSYFSTDNKG